MAGVYRDPYVFLTEALELKHPFNMEGIIPEVTREALVSILSLSPQELAAKKAKTIANLLRVSSELEPEEEALRPKINGDVFNVLRGKKLALLLSKAGWLVRWIGRLWMPCFRSDGFH